MSSTCKCEADLISGGESHAPVVPPEDKSMSEKARARFTREGRGTGEGADYVAGLKLRELRGVGRMHRFSSSRCGGRQIALPSDMALATFLEEHWDPETCELLELFPLLDVDETMRIARSIGVKHPTFKDRSPRILLTDLLVCKRMLNGYTWSAVHTVSASAGNAEASPTYLIEKEFWRRAGVASRISYTRGMNSPRVRNLWLLFGYSEQVVACGITGRERAAQEAVIRRLRTRRDARLRDACAAAACASKLTCAECVRAVLQLIATRAIECCLDVPLLLTQPVDSIRFADETTERR